MTPDEPEGQAVYEILLHTEEFEAADEQIEICEEDSEWQKLR